VLPPTAIRCLYKKDQQIEAVQPFFKMVERLDALLGRGKNDDGLIEAVLPAFLRLIVHYSLALKHPAYEEEAEIRLVSLTTNDASQTAVRFREGQLGLTPFIAIPMSKGDERIPIREVITGPKQSNGAVAGTRLYLSSKFHRDAIVRRSNTPFR
jgi:hypothetical protein